MTSPMRREISVIISANYRPSSIRFAVPLGLARILFGLVALALLAGLAGLVLVAGGTYRFMRLAYLESRNRALEVELAKVAELKQRLERLEKNSRNIATMLGVELTPPPVNWDSVPHDSFVLPHWVREQVWGSHPVPVLVPVEGARVSQGWAAGHEGIDLATEASATVKASADGVVLQRGTDRVFGRFLLVGHDSGYQTFYGHLLDWSVHQGDTVLAGQRIGRVGTGGRSTGPHLHFEVRQHGQRVDPGAMIRF